MLSIKEIHYIIETELQTLGSYYYNDFEPEEIDEVINSVIFAITSKIKSKKDYQSFNVLEKQIYNQLLTTRCDIPTLKDGVYELDLDSDNLLNANFTVYNSKCKSHVKVDSIKNGSVYLVNKDTLYNGKWYLKCEFITGNSVSDFEGDVTLIDSAVKNGQLVSQSKFSSYSSNFFDTIIYSQVGKKLKTISKFPISKVCYDYIKDFDSLSKASYCNGVTIQMSESLQRFIIELSVNKLNTILEKNQSLK